MEEEKEGGGEERRSPKHDENMAAARSRHVGGRQVMRGRGCRAAELILLTHVYVYIYIYMLTGQIRSDQMLFYRVDIVYLLACIYIYMGADRSGQIRIVFARLNINTRTGQLRSDLMYVPYNRSVADQITCPCNLHPK